MNELLERLQGGSINSDGKASEVADEVLQNKKLLTLLLHGLDQPDDIVRARTAHALERISRSHPEWLYEHIEQLLALADRDKVPAVKWHLAMIFGHLAGSEDHARMVLPALTQLLKKEQGVFTQSWAIVSLCIIGRRFHHMREDVIRQLSAMRKDPHASIRNKVAKALHVLNDAAAPMPSGWVKSTKHFAADSHFVMVFF